MLLQIPYKGSGPLTTDLLGGQITMSFDTITPVLPHIEAGKPRLLAATTVKRSSALPDVPTLAESGLAGFDIGTWFGVLAPAANAGADGPADQGRDRQVRQARQTGQRRHRIAHRPKAPRNASCQGILATFVACTNRS